MTWRPFSHLNSTESCESVCRSLRKLVVAAFALAWVVMGMSGCSYFLGPKAGDAKPIEMKDESLGCLDSIGADLDSWSKTGKPDPAQPVSCLVTALNRFSERTAGLRNDGWSRAELAHFFASFLERKGKDPTRWLSEALKLKQTLLGGSSDRLSREELGRIKGWLAESLPTLQALSTQAPALFFQTEKADPAALEPALQSLLQLTESLAMEVSKSPSGQVPFETSAIPELLRRMEVNAPVFVEYLPMMEAVKSIAIGGSAEIVRPSEWPRLLRTAGRLWVAGLRLRYQIYDNDRALDRDLVFTNAAVSEALDLLDNAVKAQKSEKGVSNVQIELLIDELGTHRLLPLGLSAATLKGLVPSVLGKMLYGVARADHEARSSGFGLEQLKTLRSIFEDWLQAQGFIRDAFAGRDEIEADDLVGLLRGAPNVGLRWRGQLEDLLAKGRPLHTDEQGRLRVVSRKEESRLNVRDLNKLNAVRAAATALLTAYAHDPKAASRLDGLTEDETQEVYLDIRELGRELGFVDTRNTRAGARTFMEASIFTSVSDGDERIGLHEVVEWFHMAFGGGVIATRIHDDLKAECGIDTLDVMGKRKLKTDCFRRRLRERFADYFPNMPNFVKWYQEGGQERADDVQRFAERAARGVGYSDQPIDSAEIRALVPILHYAENIMATRDKGNKGYLDSDELWDAYPVIKPFISKVAGAKVESESLQKAIFSWLVVFGEPPSSDWIGGGKVLTWSVVRHVWGESATRLDILKIMSSLATVSSRNRQKAIEDFFKNSQSRLRALVVGGDEATSGKIGDLFQCQKEVWPILTEKLKSQVDRVLPHTVEETNDATAFIEGVKAIIASDQRLEFHCLPF